MASTSSTELYELLDAFTAPFFTLSSSFTKHASHSVLLLSSLFATALRLLSLDSSPKTPLNPLQAEIPHDRSVVRARYFSIFLRIFLLILCRSFLCLLSLPYIIYRWIIVIFRVCCVAKSQSLFASLFVLVIVLFNVNVVVVVIVVVIVSVVVISRLLDQSFLRLLFTILYHQPQPQYRQRHYHIVRHYVI